MDSTPALPYVSWVEEGRKRREFPWEVEVEILTRASKEDPDNFQLAHKLVEVLIFHHAWDDAATAAKEYSIRNPQDPVGKLFLSSTLVRMKRHEEAVDVMVASLESGTPFEPRVWAVMAYCLLRLGRLSQAHEYLARARRVGEPDPVATRFVTKCLLILERPDELIAYVEEEGGGRCVDDTWTRAHYVEALARTGVLDNRPELEDYFQLIRPTKMEFQGAEEVNQRLAAHFEGNPHLFYEPGLHSTKRGSQVYLNAQSHPDLQKLISEIRSRVDVYLEWASEYNHPLFSPPFPPKARISPWVVTLQKSGYHHPHIHPSGVVSGVYYVKIPRAVSESPDVSSGWLRFAQSDNHRDLPPNRPKLDVRPEEGLLILFPSFLFHSTIPLDVDGTRIAIAFDVVPIREEADRLVYD